jgi:hemerythrin-like domain-containing protein
MKCTELLIRDHEIIARSLDILDGMIQNMEDGKRIEVADILTILKFLHSFVDNYHQTMEEHVLFPALLRAAPPNTAVQSMIREHGEERLAVAGIAEALKHKVGKEFVRSSRHLSVSLRNHLSREDAVLSELAGQLLSEDEDNAIFRKFIQGRPESQFPNFPYLERKYSGEPQRALIRSGGPLFGGSSKSV